MRILDRYIIKSFLFNYILALGVLVGMFIVFDLVVNFDNFTKVAPATTTMAAPSPAQVIWDIIDYYSFQMLVIFQLVSGIIPLLAAGFTMVRMTRHHELTAMIASGMSLYRVAAPIVLVSIGFGALTVINQEFIISQPWIVEKLLRKHDQVSASVTRTDPIYFVRDEDNSLLLATAYDPVKKEMKDVRIIQRDKDTSATIGRIMAEQATWTQDSEYGEAWVMPRAMFISDQEDVDPTQRMAGKTKSIAYGGRITPTQLDLIFKKKAVDFLSSTQVRDLAARSPDINKPPLYKIMHLRFTQPLMNIVMLLIGIPFLLTRVPNRLIVNMMYCMFVSGVVFIATFVIFQMGGTMIDPLLGAWLPVMIFGPFAVVMLDMIKT